jgi:hypothetical protein
MEQKLNLFQSSIERMEGAFSGPKDWGHLLPADQREYGCPILLPAVKTDPLSGKLFSVEYDTLERVQNLGNFRFIAFVRIVVHSFAYIYIYIYIYIYRIVPYYNWNMMLLCLSGKTTDHYYHRFFKDYIDFIIHYFCRPLTPNVFSFV